MDATITETAAIAGQAAAFRKAYEALTAAAVPFLRSLPKDSSLQALADLNKETAELAAEIQKNFEELGI